MAAKLAVLAMVLGAASALGGYGGSLGGYGGALGGYGGHGVAYSSQSIQTAHSIAAPALVHAAPVLHAAPVVHAAPLVHAAPVVHAAPLLHSAPIVHAAPVVSKVAVAPVAKQVIDYVDAHPEYKFEYGIHDAHTGDIKSQAEERKGDVVHGTYSLVEPDGSKRVVEYTADDHNGFNAIVHREHNAHPQVVQKVIAAPVAKVAYAASPIISHLGGHY